MKQRFYANAALVVEVLISEPGAPAVDGVHIVLRDAARSLIGFTAVVPRPLRHNEVAFDTGDIEGVAIRADQQGLGLAAWS